MKVVLDSNVLVSSLGKKSLLRPIWDAFVEGYYQIVISEDILKEYEEILQEHAAPGAAEVVMEIFIESPDVTIKRYTITGMPYHLILTTINFSILLSPLMSIILLRMTGTLILLKQLLFLK